MQFGWEDQFWPASQDLLRCTTLVSNTMKEVHQYVATTLYFLTDMSIKPIFIFSIIVKNNESLDMKEEDIFD